MAHPIEKAVLDEQTGRDAGLQCEILGLFVRQADALRTMVARRAEPGELADALHRTQGSCRAVGARNLGELSEAGERELRNTGSLSPDSMALLTAEIGEVCRYAAALHAALADTASPNDLKADKHLRPSHPGQRDTGRAGS